MLTISDYYERNLPHIAARERPLFITFATRGRWKLPPGARTIALRHIVWGHGVSYFIHVAVVMPDHVHFVMTLPHSLAADSRSLGSVMKSIKGVSARRINQLLGRKERVWQVESFDHDIRRLEGFQQVCLYILDNPIRAGLAASVDDYPWIWRAWLEGRAHT
jgi:putative transposase